MTLGKLRRVVLSWRRRLLGSVRPAINDLDAKLEAYLDIEGGFFIEAGANDGYSQSNTYYLEKRKGWTGILVEGIPELYEQCVLMRPNAKVYNCALVSDANRDPTVTMHYAGLMSVVEGALKSGAAQQGHINRGLHVQKIDNSYSVTVPARTLSSILDELPSQPKIDLFSLDVEGNELDVLKGSDLPRFRPRFLLVEARFFEDVDRFLRGIGYELVERLSHHDYLYKLP